MKTLFSLLVLLAGFAAHAEMSFGLQCEVNETQFGRQTLQKFQLLGSEDSHGSVQNFTLKSFTQFEGMVALLGTNVVIHLYDKTTGYAFTTHSDLTGTGYAYYQLLFPTQDVGRVDMVSVTCVRRDQ